MFILIFKNPAWNNIQNKQFWKFFKNSLVIENFELKCTKNTINLF